MIKPLQSITLKNDGGEDTTYVVASAPAIVETTEPASVASFADGAEGIPVSSLIADINPVQNLNGQSAPYPAGGGKNLVAPFRDAEGTSSYGLTMTPNANGSVRVHGTASNSSAVLLSLKSVSIPLPAGTYTFNIGITSSSNKVYGQVVTGAHIFFSRTAKDTFTVASDTTITRLDIGCNAANGEQIDVTIYPQLEAGSTASDYAPYSNVCPITGWTGMNVTRTGANLWDEETQTGYWNSLTGVHANSQGQLCSKNYIPIISGNTYYFRKGSTTNQGEIIFYDANKNYIGYLTAPSYVNKTFTAPEGSAYAQFNLGSSYGTTYKHDISVNYPSTDHNYHAYNGTTYPISWADEAGTVYGGTLTVNENGTGSLVVDRGKYTFTGAENQYTEVSNSRVAIKTALTLPSSTNVICNEFVAQTGGGSYFYITTTMTAQELKTFMGNNDVYAIYELATPVTYTLTDIEVITTLKGLNNILADTGDVEVSYVADTKLYIDAQIAAL